MDLFEYKNVNFSNEFSIFSKAINNQYEIFVLSVGDFDERIFLGEEANVEIGTPAKSIMPKTSTVTDSPSRGHLAKKNLDFEVGYHFKFQLFLFRI